MDTQYCLTLLQAERAGNEKLRKIFKGELKRLKEQSLELFHVVKKDRVLSNSDRATFYSNWFYSGIAVLSSVPGFQTPTELVARTGVSLKKVNQAVEFLVNTGICKMQGEKIIPGAQSTHLESGSPLVSRHHGNWRVKAMERHPDLSEGELAYSSPMSISEKDANRIRNLLTTLVKEVSEIRDPSPCEKAYGLNIDWFRF